MIVTHKPTRAVFRHQQDTGTNCGRACVQSVISSITQSPPAGGTPPASTTPVPVDQPTLQSRELDVKDGTGDVWYTHPDELLALLKTANELAGLPFHKPTAWRIGSHAALELLMADVVNSLKKGVPPIVNIRTIDHWAVVAGAGLDGGVLKYVLLVDPTDTPSAAPHTYRDACSPLSNGQVYAPWKVVASDLGALSFDVGTTPPPAGLKNYTGKFVTVAHGSKAKPAVLTAMANAFASAPGWTPSAAIAGMDPLLVELHTRASDWGLVQLQRLLVAHPRHQVRLVNDIAGGSLQHRLLSLYSDQLQYGLIGVFGATEPRLAHFRFTTSRMFELSLNATPPAETLWWTRARQLRFGSPYFPFRRRTLPSGVPEFRRLIDEQVFAPI